MRIPGSDRRGRTTRSVVAAEDASRLADAAAPLVDRAVGSDWYDTPGNEIDFAAYTLCRLRRARAGEKGGQLHGDEAVRAALVQADPEALIWFASRAISYMDESGFPEAVQPWFAETREPEAG
jgi:hypothetical protein